MADWILPIIAGAGTWAVLVALFLVRAKRVKKQPIEWAKRKRAHFPIGNGGNNNE